MNLIAAAGILLQRHRSRLLVGLVLLIVLMFMSAFAGQTLRAAQLRSDAAEQRVIIANIERENAQLSTQLQRYEGAQWDIYAQARARRDLNLANANEYVLMIDWKQAADAPPVVESTPAPTVDERPNWRKWVDAFLND